MKYAQVTTRCNESVESANITGMSNISCSIAYWTKLWSLIGGDLHFQHLFAIFTSLHLKRNSDKAQKVNNKILFSLVTTFSNSRATDFGTCECNLRFHLK